MELKYGSITMFQSTYLYKVRRLSIKCLCVLSGFNPRTYIRYDSCWSLNTAASRCFNPRTYIRYDTGAGVCFFLKVSFNPRTYIRYDSNLQEEQYLAVEFQSTYLYKVRPITNINVKHSRSFNPRTYIRYDARVFSQYRQETVSIHVPI